jgi:peptidyl-prolyl cis-trans isomerase SurA
LFTSGISTAHAADKKNDAYRIAAVVNDDMVSRMEVEDRMRLIVATTGLSDTREVRARLAPQVLRGLIDEKLQLQAAREANISVGKKELRQAVAMLEKQRRKEPGSLLGYLTQRGVPPQTFLSQLEAQLAWNRFIGRKLSSSVTVSEEEVAREAERLQNGQSRTRREVLLSSALMPVDRPEHEAATKKLAQKLAGEIRQGADLVAIASQLSGGGALNASRVWMEVDALDPVLADAVRRQKEPGMLEPLRTPSGYHLIQVHEYRTRQHAADAEALFREIVMRLRYDAPMKEVDVLMQIAREVAKNPGTCAQKNVAGIEKFEDMDFKVNHVRTRLSLMSPEVQPIAHRLRVGDISEPFATPDGIRLLMLCEKTPLPTGKANLKKIRERLLEEKYQIEALRRLRDLRREAFVEVRR